mmetsp:Transcript_8577/g.35351  ORF Transcript_8577/g.35351 Transcript_8577/m.35351 type:complete len:278 (+) Transcript_8577:1333-2166(+)
MARRNRSRVAGRVLAGDMGTTGPAMARSSDESAGPGAGELELEVPWRPPRLSSIGDNPATSAIDSSRSIVARGGRSSSWAQDPPLAWGASPPLASASLGRPFFSAAPSPPSHSRPLPRAATTLLNSGAMVPVGARGAQDEDASLNRWGEKAHPLVWLLLLLRRRRVDALAGELAAPRGAREHADVAPLEDDEARQEDDECDEDDKEVLDRIERVGRRAAVLALARRLVPLAHAAARDGLELEAPLLGLAVVAAGVGELEGDFERDGRHEHEDLDRKC